MSSINKTVWKVGHVLSRKGLIDAACQMRDISQAWDENPLDSQTAALKLLDDLYLKEGAIDLRLWHNLKERVVMPEQTGQKPIDEPVL